MSAKRSDSDRAMELERELREARWELLTEQAAHGQTAHVRARLEEELGKVRAALEGSGLHYCEGYDDPIRRLRELADI